MGSIRLRKWKTHAGRTAEAWSASFTDADGKRLKRQFATYTEAEAFLLSAGEVALESAPAVPSGSLDFLYIIGPDFEAISLPMPLKIGRSVSPVQRCKNLQSGSPVPLVIHAAYGVDDAAHIESACHQEFDKYHSHGEWYLVSVTEVQRFISSWSMGAGVNLEPAEFAAEPLLKRGGNVLTSPRPQERTNDATIGRLGAAIVGLTRRINAIEAALPNQQP